MHTKIMEVSRLLTYSQLAAEKGITFSRLSLWRKMKDGTFPQSVRVSSARIAWRESEIDDWLVSLAHGRANQPGKRGAQ